MGILGYFGIQLPDKKKVRTFQNTETIIKLLKEGYEADPQLVNELKDKIQSLEKELEERSRITKDKRTEDALIAFKNGKYEKARTLFETLQKEEQGKLAKTAYNLGNVYFVELDFSKALKAYLDAVRLAPNNTSYLNEAGYTFHTLAQYDKAIEYYEKALKSDSRTFGEDHPNVATYWNNLGGAWKAKGEYDKAIEYYEKALKSDIKTFGEDHSKVATYRNNMGEAWIEKGGYDKAIEYLEKALKSDLKTIGEDHPDVAIRWSNLGSAWYAKGEYDKAIEYYEKSLSVCRVRLGNDHPHTKLVETSLSLAKKAKLDSK